MGGANVRATVRRNHVDNLVTRNPKPCAVHLHFIVMAPHATLGRAAIRLVAARALAVISFKLGVEVPMPFIVINPVMPLLRRSAYT